MLPANAHHITSLVASLEDGLNVRFSALRMPIWVSLTGFHVLSRTGPRPKR
jgi:hypothetical protein